MILPPTSRLAFPVQGVQIEILERDVTTQLNSVLSVQLIRGLYKALESSTDISDL